MPLSVYSYAHSVLLSSLAAMICVGCIDPESPQFLDGATPTPDLGAIDGGPLTADVQVIDAGTPDAVVRSDGSLVGEDDAFELPEADAGLDAEVADAFSLPDASPPGSLFAGGEGTLESPYLITTTEHLHNVRCRPAAHFILGADLTFAEGERFVPIGGELAAGPDCSDTIFRGQLSGAGHIICGLDLTWPDAEVPVGLFSRVDGADISQLSLVGVTVRAGDTPAGTLIGESASFPQREAFLADVSVSGTVITNGPAGGLVGAGEYITFSQTSFSGRISARGPLGGIAGRLENAFLTDVQVLGERINAAIVEGAVAQPVGGLVGELRGTSAISRFTVYVEQLRGEQYVGGAVGRVSTDLTLSEGYTSGVLEAAGLETGFLGGLVGHHQMSQGLVDVFSTMDISAATPRASVGKIVGGHDGELTLTRAYFEVNDPNDLCVGPGYEVPASCVAIDGDAQYFKSVGNPPMSFWARNFWTFFLEQLPALNSTGPPPTGACDR
ncbi:MAG: hypothetical protein ACE366_07605 [Bradymonadia bacterium]